MANYQIYSPTGAIGMTFPEASLGAVEAQGVDAICCDAGSTDPGPAYLAEGKPFFPPEVCKRDLKLLLRVARKQKIPLIIGSSGFAGVDAGVDLFAGLVREAANELDMSGFKLARVYSEQSKSYLHSLVDQGRAESMHPATDPLSRRLVNSCTHVVAAIGVEPYQKALDDGADVILAGRSTDAAIFAAPAMRAGVPEAAAWHAGKILECGASSAMPQMPFDGVVASFSGDAFVVAPANPDANIVCTPYSVAAHFMHETSSPIILHEPSGTLDVSRARYEAVDRRSVRVSGGSFTTASHYTMKLEGAEILGYRTVTVGAVRDPLLKPQLRDWLEKDIRTIVADKIYRLYEGKLQPSDYHLLFRLYGLGVVMGAREAPIVAEPTEIGVVVEVVAPTPEMSQVIAVTTRQSIMHGAFSGRKNWLGGNLAVPFPELKGGPAARFVLSHRILPVRWEDAIRIEYEMI